ncbi:MAG TPA: DUF2513 domain-containing protein [Anaerolineales bacterium]|nr:DUF2513 domain-containing protein [Anaerolineales bacterium]
MVGVTEPAGRFYLVRRLTWQGYEFMDAMRDGGRWKKAKDIADKAGGITFDLLKVVLVELAKSSVREFM